MSTSSGTTREAWIRRLLFLIGVWNILGGVGALADPGGHIARMHQGTLAMSDPLVAFFYRTTWINVIAWGFGYVVASRLAGARAPILVAGALGKSAYAVACVTLYLQGRAVTAFLVTGLLDVAFAGFFLYVVWAGVGWPDGTDGGRSAA